MRVTLFPRWNWSAVCPFDSPVRVIACSVGTAPRELDFHTDLHAGFHRA